MAQKGTLLVIYMHVVIFSFQDDTIEDLSIFEKTTL